MLWGPPPPYQMTCAEGGECPRLGPAQSGVLLSGEGGRGDTSPLSSAAQWGLDSPPPLLRVWDSGVWTGADELAHAVALGPVIRGWSEVEWQTRGGNKWLATDSGNGRAG
ncbi:hypothetical protein NDU88_000226 [Pleurodeles waltl]|uniref:Uncharacterized protein n=1 Tax=Pleurodeles waltl TaxID=8319 RepID=A0AAV7VWS6_PLEWA|nr:hypothetical protein NDU88_000226 [Pleurodeles waltl]